VPPHFFTGGWNQIQSPKCFIPIHDDQVQKPAVRGTIMPLSEMFMTDSEFPAFQYFLSSSQILL